MALASEGAVIVSRTPLRISFFGGGTDYPAWSREHGGKVLSATIDKYTFLTVRRLPPFFEHKNRIVYRRIEMTASVKEIQHPTVRAVLEHLGLEGMEIHHDADLPARSGMGTSSAFTVGLLNACHALEGRRTLKENLALDAIHVEQILLQETVGSQDQVAAAYGGLNQIAFKKGFSDGACRGSFEVDALPLPSWRLEELQNHLLLFFTGIARTASDVASSFVPGLATNAALHGSEKQVEDAIRILDNPGSILPFGSLLHDAWTKKRSISSKISTPAIDTYYATAREAGAIGGKLLGAGGGGFLLFFAPPKAHQVLRSRLGLLEVPFRFETGGSRILVYEPG